MKYIKKFHFITNVVPNGRTAEHYLVGREIARWHQCPLNASFISRGPIILSFLDSFQKVVLIICKFIRLRKNAHKHDSDRDISFVNQRIHKSKIHKTREDCIAIFGSTTYETTYLCIVQRGPASKFWKACWVCITPAILAQNCIKPCIVT